MKRPRTHDDFSSAVSSLVQASQSEPTTDQGETPIALPAPSREVMRHSGRPAIPDDVRLAFLASVEAGETARAAAIKHGVSIRSAYRFLAETDEAELEETRAAFRKLLQVEALKRLDDWRTASVVGANKRGNHGPAKDWLLHAGVIDALDSDASGVRIAINIGTDDKPMRIASPLQVLRTQGDSDDDS